MSLALMNCCAWAALSAFLQFRFTAHFDEIWDNDFENSKYCHPPRRGRRAQFNSDLSTECEHIIHMDGFTHPRGSRWCPRIFIPVAHSDRLLSKQFCLLRGYTLKLSAVTPPQVEQLIKSARWLALDLWNKHRDDTIKITMTVSAPADSRV